MRTDIADTTHTLCEFDLVIFGFITIVYQFDRILADTRTLLRRVQNK